MYRQSLCVNICTFVNDLLYVCTKKEPYREQSTTADCSALLVLSEQCSLHSSSLSAGIQLPSRSDAAWRRAGLARVLHDGAHRGGSDLLSLGGSAGSCIHDIGRIFHPLDNVPLEGIVIEGWQQRRLGRSQER